MNRQVHWTRNMLVFREMVEEADVLAWISVSDGYCAYYSPAWHSFTGTPTGSNFGMSWLELLHPDDRVKTRRAFFEANDGGKEYAVSYRLKKSDGTYQLVWGHGLPCFDNKGCFTGYLGMTQPMDKYASPVEALANTWSSETHVSLSPREKAVFALIAQGYRNDDVAAELGVSLRAVESSVARGTEKLGATNRVHAVVKAIKLNEI